MLNRLKCSTYLIIKGGSCNSSISWGRGV